MIDAGSSSSLQYVANKQGDLVYYNNIGLSDDGDGKAGWVYVFPSNDSKVAKTPAKKPKVRPDSFETNKGLGVVVKIQGTPGDFIFAGLDGNTEVLVVYHPPKAKAMTSDSLRHGWSKFDFGESLLVDYFGSPTHAVFILKADKEEDKKDEESSDEDEAGSELSGSCQEDGASTVDLAEEREKKVRISMLFGVLFTCAAIGCYRLLQKLIDLCVKRFCQDSVDSSTPDSVPDSKIGSGHQSAA